MGAGAARLREAVSHGRLQEELERFSAELSEKQFTGASIDKQTNTGGQGGLANINKDTFSASDRDVVWALMQEMVQHLTLNWEKERTAYIRVQQRAVTHI